MREFRLASKKEPTKKMAESLRLCGNPAAAPAAYGDSQAHFGNPEVHAVRVFSAELIIHDSCSASQRDPYHFGVLSSAMHMAWVHQVCGRLKSDYRYSTRPGLQQLSLAGEPTARQQNAVEEAARAVLDARRQFSDATLADLYDPLRMPPDWSKPTPSSDRAVDRCYRARGLYTERQRVEFLFALYEKLTAPLPPSRKTQTPKLTH